MTRAALVLFVAAALTACQTAHAPPPPVPTQKPVVKTIVKQVCIQPGDWSDADKKALHDALVPIPDGSIIIRMARDWYRLNADAKACQDSQK